MRVLFLDDDEHRQKTMKSMLPCIKQVRTADETVEAIESEGGLDYLFLDHDLGGEVYVSSDVHNTGATVAKWLVTNPQSIRLIVLHTHNPVGRENMYNILSSSYHVAKTPFLSEIFCSLVDAIEAEREIT